MTAVQLRLVVFVSLAHMLVHVYELSLSGAEQLIAEEFSVQQDSTGRLATAFRLPFGLLALGVGWLVDRWGAKPMLVTYLFGCALTAFLASIAPSFNALYVTMFFMGVFASIYHPAGLALISQTVPASDRPRALGIHGILGSAGIGGTSLIAAAIFCRNAEWRAYYTALIVPGVLLGIWFLARLPRDLHGPASSHAQHQDEPSFLPRWKSFFLLTLLGAVGGFLYAAFVTFLPRYLDSAMPTYVDPVQVRPEALRNFLTSGVLLLGMAGQYTAGRFARPRNLETFLASAFFVSCPRKNTSFSAPAFCSLLHPEQKYRTRVSFL